jgi:phage-related protein
MKRDRKPIEWIGSCLKDLREFPEDVKDAIGVALDVAQQGDKHDAAKPLQGFGGAGVLEVIDDFDGDTYRAVYTVKFKGVVYALHAFQKKSKKGISTPKDEIDLVKKRLKAAEEHYKENYERGRP